MRLIAVVTERTDSDVTWNLVNQGIWAVVEADFAIISGKLALQYLGTHGSKFYQILIASSVFSMSPDPPTPLDDFPLNSSA